MEQVNKTMKKTKTGREAAPPSASTSGRPGMAAWIAVALLAVAGPVESAAQIILPAEPPRVLVSLDGESLMDPEWSPDGASIAFTGQRYRGLWVANADGSQIRRLTDEDAGFGFRWSGDSRRIVSRVSRYEEKDQTHAVVVFDAGGKEEPVEVTPFRSHMPSLPEWNGQGDSMVWIPDAGAKRPEVVEVAVDGTARMPKQAADVADRLTRPRVAVLGDRLLYWEPGSAEPRDLSPFGAEGYLNARLSPDGRKVVFEHYGGNLHLVDVATGALADLGRAFRPDWSPDGRHVVAMVTEDDGYTYSRSDLVVFAADGSMRVNLTEDFDPLAMNPSWSPDGSRIAFDAPEEGVVYVLQLLDAP